MFPLYKVRNFFVFVAFFVIVCKLRQYFIVNQHTPTSDHVAATDRHEHRFWKTANTYEELKKQLKRQNDRKKSLGEVCKRLRLTSNETFLNDDERITNASFKSIYVDDHYRLLYCAVPKVACTNWKRILLILTGKMNTSDPNELKLLEDIERVLRR